MPLKKWNPGEPLSYYPDSGVLCDDRAGEVAETPSHIFGAFAVTASRLAEWLDRNPELFYDLMKRTRGQDYDEFYRHLSHLRGLAADEFTRENPLASLEVEK